MAIDAAFAIRMSHDVDLPAVSLITAFDLIGWKYHGDVRRSVRARLPEFKFPDGSHEAAVEALHYMQTMDWVVENARPDTVVTLDTVLHLHDMLINGSTDDNRYQGFRTSFLPHKKGSDPAAIPAELSDLCCFASSEMYSPLGQASVIHHAFERMVPFDSMIDRTGLVLSFMSLFRRGVVPAWLHGSDLPGCLHRQGVPPQAQGFLARPLVARGARALSGVLGGVQRAQHVPLGSHLRFVSLDGGQAAFALALAGSSDTGELGARSAA